MVYGIVGMVLDLYEIVNVNGLEGVKYMIENGNMVFFKFSFGVFFCVFVIGFEFVGVIIGVDGIVDLLDMLEVWYLVEMMNYFGVLYVDKEVM